MLNIDVNSFEPGQNIKYDTKYSADKYEYCFEREEQELQDKLFEVYDQLQEEYEES